MKIIFLAVAAILTAGTAHAHEDEAKPKQALVHEQKQPKEVPDAVSKPATHSGGTDANGCHTNHATGDYHCHNPKR